MKRGKRVLCGLLAITLLAMSLAACSSGTASSGGAASGGQASAAQAGGETTIVLMNSKMEIDAGLKAATDYYAAQNPGVNFEVVSMLEEPGSAELKTRFAGGQAPDIFPIAGYRQIETWETYLEDLSDQPWVNDMLDVARDGIELNGKVYGLPLCVEGGAYMYNKDMFTAAGIDTLPGTRAELSADLDKLRGAGFTPIIADGGWFALGKYVTNYGFANQDDPVAFIDGLNNGTETIVGNKAFIEAAEYFQWEASQVENMLSIDFMAAVSMMGNSEAAIGFGGNWNQLSFDEINPDLHIGFMPVPVTDDAAKNDYVLAGVSNYWCVNKDSPAKEEAKAFLSWLVTSKEGQNFMTSDMSLIPAFSSFSASEDSVGYLGAALTEYINAGKIKNFYIAYYPDGAHQAFGEATQKLIAGEATVDEYLQTLQDEWDRLK